MFYYSRNPIATLLINKNSDYYRDNNDIEIKKSHLGFVFPPILYVAILIFSILPTLGLIIFAHGEALFFLLSLNASFFFLLVFSLIYKSIISVKKLDTFLTGTPIVGKYVSSKLDVIGYVRYVTYIEIDSSNIRLVVRESVIHKHGNYKLLLKKKMVTGQIRIMLPIDHEKSKESFVSELGDYIPGLLHEHPDHFFAGGEVKAFRR